VDLKVDIWMLGCIIFSLCFGRHPFQEAQKLAIINAQYQIPVFEPDSKELTSVRISENLKDLIRLLLTPNPINRPSLDALSLILDNFFNLTSITLNEDALEIKRRH
jgi:AP2-associated kinase